MTRYLRKNKKKEEGFLLAHGFRGFSAWSADSIAFRPAAREKHHGGRV
jgi:hypothetical protein